MMRFPRDLSAIALASLFLGAGFAVPVSAEDTLPFTDDTLVISGQSETGGDETAPIVREMAMPSEITPVSAPAATVATTYTVVRGDTLSRIAARLLGDARRYPDLVKWNAARYPSLLKNPNLILVGWTIEIPGTEGSAEGTTVVSDSRTGVPVTAPATTVAQAPVDPVTTPGSTPTSTPTPAATPVTTVQPQPAAEPGSGGPLITPDSRVLHIGDSHTVGIYGTAMDSAMRGTGAKVQSVGVAGSSPSWWLKGTVTKCGFSARDENGKLDQPADWRTPRATPLLPNLISQFKPTVIVISLGANLIGASPERVKQEVQQLMAVAKSTGASIVWVGPPNGREANKPSSRQDQLYANLKAAVGKDATFVDSRPVTHYPTTGGDGIHYGGTEGSRIARDWAGKTFDSIQHSGPPADR